jgi:hypothetical protein
VIGVLAGERSPQVALLATSLAGDGVVLVVDTCAERWSFPLRIFRP